MSNVKQAQKHNVGVTSSIVSSWLACFVTLVWGNHEKQKECEDATESGGEKGLGPECQTLGFPTPVLLLFSVPSLRSHSNPWPLKTSRQPPLIMTRLSNPIAVAQTQGSALKPLESDCFSRVKWLRPPCHSPGHRHHCAAAGAA